MKFCPIENLSVVLRTYELPSDRHSLQDVFLALEHNMPTGQIKNLKPNFGFISQDDGTEIFVHKSELKDAALKVGSTVEFQIKQGAKGPNAYNVVRVPADGEPAEV